MKRAFVESVGWQKIVLDISEQITIKSIAGVTESKTFEELRYTAGYVAALRDVLDLPNTLLKDDDEEEKATKEEKGVLRLANSPRARTNFLG